MQLIPHAADAIETRDQGVAQDGLYTIKAVLSLAHRPLQDTGGTVPIKTCSFSVSVKSNLPVDDASIASARDSLLTQVDWWIRDPDYRVQYQREQLEQYRDMQIVELHETLERNRAAVKPILQTDDEITTEAETYRDIVVLGFLDPASTGQPVGQIAFEIAMSDIEKRLVWYPADQIPAELCAGAEIDGVASGMLHDPVSNHAMPAMADTPGWRQRTAHGVQVALAHKNNGAIPVNAHV